MKKVILLTVFSFSTSLLFAQSKWSVELNADAGIMYADASINKAFSSNNNDIKNYRITQNMMLQFSKYTGKRHRVSVYLSHGIEFYHASGSTIYLGSGDEVTFFNNWWYHNIGLGYMHRYYFSDMKKGRFYLQGNIGLSHNYGRRSNYKSENSDGDISVNDSGFKRVKGPFKYYNLLHTLGLGFGYSVQISSGSSLRSEGWYLNFIAGTHANVQTSNKNYSDAILYLSVFGSVGIEHRF